MTTEIVLASASPRRRELLDQIGIAHRVHPVGLDESMHAGETVIEHVNRLALAKAREGYRQVSQQEANVVVLGADTVVEVGGESLGKPKNTGQAAAFLARLSGKKHRVHTAVAVVTAGCEKSALSSSEVEFTELSEQQINAYIETGEPLDKAGAYAIQGIAGRFIKRLNGSYSGVMGLPLFETVQLLSACGVSFRI